MKIKTMQKKILFIYLEKGKESLAIEYLSAALKKKGHLTDLIIEYNGEKDFKKRLDKKIKKVNPDFIGFSVISDNYVWACKVAKYVKEISSAKIVFGGLHVTSCPEVVVNEDFVDYAVLGEGDQTIIELVENPKKLNIKNVWLKHKGKIIKNKLEPLLQNLDELSFPDKKLFYSQAPHLRGKYYCIVGKGCPFVCTYCFNNYMKKLYQGQKWVRKRSVKSVIEELVVMKKEMKYTRVYFADDCLTDNKEWLREFTKEYIKHVNVPFSSQSHAHFLGKEVCGMLREAGCIKMIVGSQTPLEEKRREICKRFDTNEEIQNAVDNLKKNKIIVQVDHIFKLPTETVEDYRKGLDFYIDLKPDVFGCFILQYYPNVEITEIGKKHGNLSEEEADRLKQGDVRSITSLYNKENLEILRINRFIHWIPVLPRGLSRFIVRKQLYFMFFSDYLDKIPFLLRYFTSPTLLRGLPATIKRVRTLRRTKIKIDRL